MNEQAFELTSLAMRYWFTGLMLAAVLCAFRLAVLDHRRSRRERQTAPNMEYVGEFLVVKGAGDVLRGERYAIYRDIVIGRRQKCDVILSDKSVFPRHARGELRSGGMLIGAIGRAPVSLRGQPIQQEMLVKDGALFCIGAITLQLTLYDVEVEYEVDGEGRAIDASSVNGDDFDRDFMPFEHEFDGEYGQAQQMDISEPDYLEGEPAQPTKLKRRQKSAKAVSDAPDIADLDDDYDDPPRAAKPKRKKPASAEPDDFDREYGQPARPAQGQAGPRTINRTPRPAPQAQPAAPMTFRVFNPATGQYEELPLPTMQQPVQAQPVQPAQPVYSPAQSATALPESAAQAQTVEAKQPSSGRKTGKKEEKGFGEQLLESFARSATTSAGRTVGSSLTRSLLGTLGLNKRGK